MNILTQCLTTVTALDDAMAPLMALKKEEFAKLHAVLNARLGLWCAKLDDLPTPPFDGARGFGFKPYFKDHIYSDELLVKLVVEGDMAHATFDPGVFIDGVFTMTLPVRYLDATTGEAAVVHDVNEYKMQCAVESFARDTASPCI